MPKKTTTPWPPQRVESASLALLKQLSMSCQLFVTQTSPEGEMARSVCICSPPPTKPPGGEIWSPVFMPGGQFSVRTPQSCVIGLWGIAKLEIQTLSLPSTTTAQGPGRPSPVNGEPGYCVPSGRSRVTLPSLPFCLDMVLVKYSVADSNPSSFRRAAMSIRWDMPSSPSPNRLVTHTLPWLSMLRPLLATPVLKFSALLGSAAGKRVTLSLAFETQIRSCWSMARWNGPRNDLHGSALSPSQTIRPLVQSPFGKCRSWRFETPRAHTSPLGVAMMPCISPSCPLKVIPSDGVSGLPFLSNTAIDLPP